MRASVQDRDLYLAQKEQIIRSKEEIWFTGVEKDIELVLYSLFVGSCLDL